MPAPVIQGTPNTSVTPIGTTYNGTSPTGVTLGEVLCAVIRVNSTNTVVALSDLQSFSLWKTQSSGTGGSLFLLVKDVTSTDVTNANVADFYAFVGDGSFVSTVTMFRASGVASSIVDTPAGSGYAQSSSWSLPSFTTQGSDRLVLRLGGGGVSVTFTVSSGTEFYEVPQTNGRSVVGTYETQASAGTVTAASISPSAASAGTAIVAALAPPATVDGPLPPDAEISRRNLTGALSIVQGDPLTSTSVLTGPRSN